MGIWFPVHAWNCPICGHTNDSYNGIVGDKRAGDTLMCSRCDGESEIINTHVEETVEIIKKLDQ